MSIPFAFSVAQVARLRGVAPHAVYDELKAGTFSPISWTRTPLRVSLQEVEKMLGHTLSESEVLAALVPTTKQFGTVTIEERSR
jgi:hypothetical protein